MATTPIFQPNPVVLPEYYRKKQRYGGLTTQETLEAGAQIAISAVLAHNGDAAAHATQIAAAVAGLKGAVYVRPAGVTAAETKYILGIDNLGRVVANDGATLYISSDDGATWESFCTVDAVPAGFRALSDGEVLIGLGENPGASKKASIWKSAGWATGTPTFSKVLESSGYTQAFSLSWAWGHDGDIVVTNEYGTDARYVYLSQDCGATWTTIYDNGVSVTPQRHLHGCTYDKWRGAIWITGGDWNGTEDNAHISVSWDLGAHWTKVTNTQQPTVSVAFPNCVCFGTDNAPNGVLRIKDPSPSNLRIEVAYRLDEAPTTSYVAGAWYRKSDSDITLINYVGGAAGTVAIVLGSFNGFDWFEAWRATEDQSKAMVTFGPTSLGNVVIRKDAGATRSTIRIPAPTNSVEAAAERAARAAALANRPAHAYFPNVFTPAYQDVVAYTYTPIQMTSIYGVSGAMYGYNANDADGIFSLDTDGLAVTIKRAGLLLIDADACFNSANGVIGYTDIKVGALSVVTGVGRKTSAVVRVAAGNKISVTAFTTTNQTLVGGNVLSLAYLSQ